MRPVRTAGRGPRASAGPPLAALVWALILGFPAAPAAAQEGGEPVVLRRVGGTVLTASDDAGARVEGPAVHVAVSVADDSGQVLAGVLTDEQGAFLISDVPAGLYTLRVAGVGYATSETRVRVAPEAEIAGEPLVIHLVQQVIGLSAVVVGTERGGHRPSEVLAGDELAGRLGTTVAATLAAEPGMAVAGMGPGSAKPVIRGLSGDRLLMLEDGVRVSDMSGSGPDHATAIDPSSARRIEVVRGPGALLFGPNALGGVINVVGDAIPASPVSKTFGSLTLQTRTVNGAWSGSGQALFPLAGMASRLEITGGMAGDLATPLGPLGNTQYNTYGLSVGSTWFGDDASVGGTYRFYRYNYGIPADPVAGHAAGVDIEMKRDAGKGRLLWHDAAGFESIQLDAAYTWYRHWEMEPPDILGTFYQSRVAGIDALARHGEKGFFARGAVGGRLSWEDFSYAGSLSTPNTSRSSAAAFAYEAIEIGRLDLEGSLRIDLARVTPVEEYPAAPIGHVRQRSFGVVSGSLGAVLDIGGGASVGATLGRAFRNPEVSELFSEGPHLAAYIYEVGEPDLDPEIGLGVDLFAGWEGERAHIDIVGFAMRLSDYIYSRDTGRLSRVRLPIYQFVGEDAQLTGFEAEFHAQLSENVSLAATASHVRGELSAESEPLPLIPPMRAGARAEYRRGAWYLGASTELVRAQERLGRFETRTDGYALFDLEAGLHLMASGGLHLVSAHLVNLSDTEYRNHLSRIKHVSPGPGRGLRVVYRVIF